LAQGGSYRLGGTAGQPDAGLILGGRYRLMGGFWGASALAPNRQLFLPASRNDLLAGP
jgi:hypothetical protein